MRGLSILSILLLVLATVPAAEAQEEPVLEQCGELELVLRNPDLRRDAEGRVHVAGNLFVQFQAIGAEADQITTFGFSFGPVETPMTEEELCDQDPATWNASGAYIINYRADQDPDDGFFINLQTDLVPDGFYTAAVHAYDANNNELARAWTNAIVDNCDGGEGSRCTGDQDQAVRQDITAPWPIMLPGDGNLDLQKMRAFEPEAPEAPLLDNATMTLEFAELLSELRVFVNREQVSLQPWSGRLWDNDLVPGYGPLGLGDVVVPECTQSPPQTCSTLGEAYQFTLRPLTNADVVRVEAVDLAGNLAKKEIHIGSGTTGAITDALPNLQITVDDLRKPGKAGQTSVFRFTMVNSGGSTAHPFTSYTGPEGWSIDWLPHEAVERGATKVQELSMQPPAATAPGVYSVNATITYPKGGGDVSQTWELELDLGAGPSRPGNTTTEPDNKKETPALPVFLVALLLVAIAVRRR